MSLWLMAYYNKKDIENYLRSELESLQEIEGAKLLTPVSQPLSELKNEKDLVGFCYIIPQEQKSSKGDSQDFDQKLPNMTTKVFVRIDHDLYTDDRYALDQYQAAQQGKTVSEIIKERHQEQQKAMRELTGDDINSISQLYKKKDVE